MGILGFLIIILLLIWILGLALHLLGAAIHLFLALAVICFIVWLFKRK